MRDRGVAFKVVLLMVSAALLFAAFVFVLGNFSFRSGYTVYADYDFSGNVQPGAPVKVSGITVGRVEAVSFHGGKIDEHTGRRVQVRVTLWIEDRAKDSIRQDAQFFINTAGVLGEQYVEIVPGHDWDRPPLEEGSFVVGVNPPRTDLVVARLYELLELVTEVLHKDKDKIAGLLEKSAAAVDKVPAFLDAATSLAKKVDASIEPREVRAAVRDARTLIVGANASMETVVREVVRVLALASEERVDKAFTVIDKAGRTADAATVLLTNVDGAVADVRAGKGTLGKLVAKPELYADLRELLRDLRKNPWKLIWKE